MPYDIRFIRFSNFARFARLTVDTVDTVDNSKHFWKMQYGINKLQIIADNCR